MSEMEPEPALLAIDLGGTRVKISRFAPDGTREETSGGDTASQTSAEDLVRLLRSVSVQLLEGRQLRGVGIGVAGVLDPVAGRIVQSPNLPYMDGFPLREKLESELGAPVTMMNDANAAALGEYFAGAPGASGSMFLLTLGTGVGGAFVQDGRIWEGAAGMAGEVGHMCIMVGGPGCNCGGKGCLEALCSGWALVRDAKKLAAEKKSSAIAGLDPITPESLAALGESGDADALALWERAGTMLGMGMANLMNLLNPDCLVLAGGLAKAGGLLLEPARQSWERHAFERAWTSTEVHFSALGEWAGVRGAIQPFLEAAT